LWLAIEQVRELSITGGVHLDHAEPVAFALRTDGLYFLAVNAGELRQIAPE
jgi:hypothetical protein